MEKEQKEIKILRFLICDKYTLEESLILSVPCNFPLEIWEKIFEYLFSEPHGFYQTLLPLQYKCEHNPSMRDRKEIFLRIACQETFLKTENLIFKQALKKFNFYRLIY